MNNNTMSNTSDAFGGVSKKFLSRLVALILEKISYRTFVVDGDLLRITGPKKTMLKNNMATTEPAILIDASDNVGIGISTPSYKLHVVGDAKFDGDIYIRGTTYTVDTGMQVTDAISVSNEGTAPAIAVSQTGSYPIIECRQNEIPVTVVNHAGAIGINTTQPLDWLHVNGFARAVSGYKVSDTVIFDASANATFPGYMDLSGNFQVNENKFTIMGQSGNTRIAGTLNVSDTFSINNDKFIIDPSGNTTINGLFVSGDDKVMIYPESGNIYTEGSIIMRNDLFVVDSANGSTKIAGSLDISDNFTVNGHKFVVYSSSGNTSIRGTLDISDNFSVNNNRFTIDASTGDTYVYGNMDVSENLRVSKDAVVMGNLYVDGYTTILGQFNIEGDFSLGTAMYVQTSGDVQITGTLDVSKNLAINADKFTVHYATGNTVLTGTLDVGDNLSINSTKFTVDSTNGDTYIDNNLTVNNQINTTNIENVITFDRINQYVNIAHQINLDKSLDINDGTATIDYATGNTYIKGTIDISDNTQISGTLVIAGETTIDNNMTVTGTMLVSQDVNMSSNLNVAGTATIADDLNVGSTVKVDVQTQQVGIATSTPTYNLDVSGNTRTIDMMLHHNMGTNGYLFKMANSYDPSFRFTHYTSDPRSYLYDKTNMVITLTMDEYPMARNAIEFDLDYYLRPNVNVRYAEFSFDFSMVNYTSTAGNGISICFFNQEPYNTPEVPNIERNGYTVYIDALDNAIKLYDGEDLLDIFFDNNPSNLITDEDTYHQALLKLSKTDLGLDVELVIDNTVYMTYTIPGDQQLFSGQYFVIAGWVTSDTMTQKVKNIQMYAEYDEPKRKLQVFGETFLKDTRVDGPLTCTGDLIIDGTLASTLQKLSIKNRIAVEDDIIVTGKIATYGTIVKMPAANTRYVGFDFEAYTIGNDFSFETEAMEITLTNGGIGSNQTVIEFNIGAILGQSSFLEEFTLSFDFTAHYPVAGGGRGIWFYFYNTNPYSNTFSGYLQSNGGFVVFLDLLYDTIQILENGNEIYNDPNANIASLRSTETEYRHLEMSVTRFDNLIRMNMKIDESPYVTFAYATDPSANISTGDYYGIGGLNGGGSLVQKFKNFKIEGKYNIPDKKLTVFGDSLLKGDVKLSGLLTGDDIDLQGTMTIQDSLIVSPNLFVVDRGSERVGIGTTEPAYKLDVVGDINLSGEIYQNGILFNVSSQWEINGQDEFYTQRNVGIAKIDPQYPLDITGPIRASGGFRVGNNLIIDNFGNITSASYIPFLNASKINAGIFDPLRIPYLDASKINSGSLNPSLIPNLDASKISSGVLNSDRIPNKIANGTIVVDLSNNTVINGGNVGIGTTAPTSTLDVSGNVNIRGNMTYQGFQVSNWKKDSNGNAYYTEGKVGIGMSQPDHTLQVDGTVHATTYENLPIKGGVVSVPAATTGDPISISVTNPFGTTNISVTGNCRPRLEGSKHPSRIIVEIGDIDASNIEFILSTSNNAGWDSTEHVVHYMVYRL